MQTDETIAARAARLVLNAEERQRLAFPGPFLGQVGPCARAEAAVSEETNPRIREAARGLHHRAKEASLCIRTIQRLDDEIATIRFPPDTSNAGSAAVEKVREALGDAERAVDEMVEGLHAGLWQALLPDEAHDSAASLLQCLDLRARQTAQAVDGRSASDSCQAWHRAANLVAWWSRFAPSAFRRAGLVAEIHLQPPRHDFEFRELLNDGD